MLPTHSVIFMEFHLKIIIFIIFYKAEIDQLDKTNSKSLKMYVIVMFDG